MQTRHDHRIDEFVRRYGPRLVHGQAVDANADQAVKQDYGQAVEAIVDQADDQDEEHAVERTSGQAAEQDRGEQQAAENGRHFETKTKRAASVHDFRLAQAKTEAATTKKSKPDSNRIEHLITDDENSDPTKLIIAEEDEIVSS